MQQKSPTVTYHFRGMWFYVFFTLLRPYASSFARCAHCLLINKMCVPVHGRYRWQNGIEFCIFSDRKLIAYVDNLKLCHLSDRVIELSLDFWAFINREKATQVEWIFGLWIYLLNMHKMNSIGGSICGKKIHCVSIHLRVSSFVVVSKSLLPYKVS